MAILELEHELNADVERYDIYRSSDELGKIGIRVGFGASGQADIQPGLSGVKRMGVNRYDLLRNDYQLEYDFDDGTWSYNTLGDLGEGNDEVFSAVGDSGSPIFIDGLVAGIAVAGLQQPLGSPAFGLRAWDERVSSHASWIDRPADLPKGIWFLAGRRAMSRCASARLDALLCDAFQSR